VKRLYEKETDLPARDRIIFNIPLNQQLQQPIHLLTIWLTNMTPIVENCILVFHAQLLRGHRDIRTYFPSNQPTIVDTVPISTDDDNSSQSTNTSISSATDETRINLLQHPSPTQDSPSLNQVGNLLLPVRFATPRVGDQDRTALC
jgi:hypothetical protein